MTTSKNEILSRLRALMPLLQEKYHLKELALFGSYARDEQTDESDIVLMVLTDKISFREYCKLYYQLKELFPKHKLEIVSKKAIKPQYFERMKNDLIYA